jgi:hypothetical protein
MSIRRYALLLVVGLAGCGGSSDSPGNVSAAIESFCREQLEPRGPVYTEVDSAECTAGGTQREVGDGRTVGFCYCARNEDCPSGLVCTPDSFAFDSFCQPAGYCTMRPRPLSECVASMTRSFDEDAARGCGPENADFIACMRDRGPFCTWDEIDATCGVESGRLIACRDRPRPDAGPSSGEATR